MITFLLTLFIQPTFGQTKLSDLPKIQYSRDPYYESEGFRLGFVIDFHRANLVIWTYEGEMMEGYGSGKADFVDPYCLDDQMAWIKNIKDDEKRVRATEQAKKECYIFTNPWAFSTMDETIFQQYKNMDKANLTPVLLYYVRPYISTEHLFTETKNFVEAILPVNGNLDIETSFSLHDSEMPVGMNLNVGKGFVDGRIVKASLDHVLRKSFEVTIQEGPYGDNFRQMSVSNQAMFDYIVKAMLTGKLVRVSYVTLTGVENSILKIGKDYDTPMRVIGVEIRTESSSTGLPMEQK